MKLLFILFLTMMVVPAIAVAQNEDDDLAKTYFFAAQKAFETEHFIEAAKQFGNAYQIKPSYKILYNIGQSYAAANRHGAALEAFEKFLADGGDKVSSVLQQEVLTEIRRLREITATIEINTVDGATIYVDDIKRGDFPTTRRIAVSAMTLHTVTIEHPDYHKLSREIKVPGGNTLEVTLMPDSKKSAQQVGPASGDVAAVKHKQFLEEADSKNDADATRLDTQKKVTIAGWTLASAGVVSLIAGSILRVASLKKEDALQNSCNTQTQSCSSSMEGTLEKRDQYRNLSTAFWITGAVLAAGGAVLILYPWWHKESNNNTVAVHVSPFGAALVGSF
ncbi:MAG: PEGA domain-containing protein [Deltaproteobacteria bacterium]|nr:PEGA domain-containing protein [Deltaproteobacteria bacterium]